MTEKQKIAIKQMNENWKELQTYLTELVDEVIDLDESKNPSEAEIAKLERLAGGLRDYSNSIMDDIGDLR